METRKINNENMERITSTQDTPLIEYKDGKYIVRWDGQDEDGKGVVSYNEITFPYKPSLDTIKEVILGIENSRVDQEILSGFTWEGMSVWLSSENQFNYKAAYDLAAQTNGGNLPVTFKFGDTDNPVYHEFKTLDDLADFYMKAMIHVNNTLKTGWESKDSIDWSLYEEALENL